MSETTQEILSMPDFEKLGQFYLGKEYDLGVGERKTCCFMIPKIFARTPSSWA